MVKHLNFEEEKVKYLAKWEEEDKVKYLAMLEKKKRIYLEELEKAKAKYLVYSEEKKARCLAKLEEAKARYLHYLDEKKEQYQPKLNIIEDRTKVPEGEVMYSSENGFSYLRSKLGEGSGKSECSIEDSFVSEVPRPLLWLILMERIGYGPLCDDLEPWMYKPYTRVPLFYTSNNHKCRPSDDIEPLFYYIKYGEGLNKYWRVKWWDEIKRDNKKKNSGKKLGNLTKEECENKGNHGNYVSTEELLERASGKGKQARNARLLLKRRGVTTND